MSNLQVNGKSLKQSQKFTHPSTCLVILRTLNRCLPSAFIIRFVIPYSSSSFTENISAVVPTVTGACVLV